VSVSLEDPHGAAGPGRVPLGRPAPAPASPGLTRGLTPGAGAAAVAMPLADVVALAAAAGWAGRAGGFPAGWPTGHWAVAAYAVSVFAALYVSGLHRLRICLRVADQAGRIIAAVALPAVALPWLTAGQAFRLAVTTAGLLIVARVITSAALRSAHRRGRLTERALLAGDGPKTAELAGLLEDHPELGLRLVGVLDCGTVNADLGAAVAAHAISRVIVCPSGDHDGTLARSLRATPVRANFALAADVCVLPWLPGAGAAVPSGCLDEVWGVPLVPLRRPAWAGHARPGRAAKRGFDVLAAAVLLVVTAPLMAVAALAVRLTLRRPALFRQVRVVGDGNLAEIVKLRTLGRHGDPDTSWSVPAGQCGALGRILRVTHIDELPQLVSVLRGDMSLVGPRPERPHFVREFSQAVPGYTGRQRMPAGLTGWAQVHGLNGDTSIRDRARFDNYYIEHWSFWLDLIVLGRTVTSIAAEAAGTASRAVRSRESTGGN
jgi:lipopolysaccharide/colanic/teichoic acid biosynthesis glycosyltransferase